MRSSRTAALLMWPVVGPCRHTERRVRRLSFKLRANSEVGTEIQSISDSLAASDEIGQRIARASCRICACRKAFMHEFCAAAQIVVAGRNSSFELRLIVQAREVRGDVVGVEGGPGKGADAVGRLAGVHAACSPRTRRRRGRAGTPPSRVGEQLASTAAPGPSAPSAHRARRPAPGRDAPRPRGRPADSDRSIRTVPSGATFRRPSSVRRITSARDADAVRRGQDRGDLVAVGDVLDEVGGAGDARAPGARSTSGFSSAQRCAHRQHLLGRARQDLGDEVQDVADAEIDRDRIPRRADAEAHRHGRWRGSPPCRAAAARPAARPRPDRRRRPPSRSADDSCGSRTGTSCRR